MLTKKRAMQIVSVYSSNFDQNSLIKCASQLKLFFKNLLQN